MIAREAERDQREEREHAARVVDDPGRAGAARPPRPRRARRRSPSPNWSGGEHGYGDPEPALERVLEQGREDTAPSGGHAMPVPASAAGGLAVVEELLGAACRARACA